MFQSKIAGIGHYVPKNVYTNSDLTRFMDTSDAWIQERTGIQERRYADRIGETTTSMGVEASKIALERAGITAAEVDFIIFATLSPDYYFPGCGVLLQREMGMGEIGALDIRNQCSGFVYALSIADQFIKTGMYKNVLVVGSEKQSFAMDFDTRSRHVSVIFGDGAGAVVMQPTTEAGKGVLSTHLHSDGAEAEKLAMYYPGAAAGFGLENPPQWPDQELGGMLMTPQMLEDGTAYPTMDGQAVFKKAVVKFPEVIHEALAKNNLSPSDIDLLIPHQANLRISQYVQKILGLPDEKIYSNIQRYGNTTAASIPIALSEAWQEGLIKEGDLVCFAAFGAGFTWGSALIRW
ncbi:3-oxoacyl-ACP synthase III family protein [Sphingobacterium corticibacter]|uniref:Beta-ketoacyl-[acyl-carrier-protein] synthase III n=1 Tax=Sphingobacterium corticibacter TaxID=2171749 RepID=A0A2T8HLG8_9SPHI|nr:beta-ketoacyl-ACP synthase III [Sphingobacterium corticibacter]PVH26233.1 3-oxoacyl-ACP synthase [Sphingobacterium corticibacter]